MKLEKAAFLKKRAENAEKRTPRTVCETCRSPVTACYCAHVAPFDPKIRFVILTHKLEMRRRIASGRMSHLFLENSSLWTGHDFTKNARVNAAIADERYQSVLLYPGEKSVNLSRLGDAERANFIPAGKILQVFVLDGTWSTSRQSMRLSENLRALPRVSFDIESESRFRIREQPKQECYSSLEAIHLTIELMGPAAGFDISSRAHDRLLSAFDKMIERQLELVAPTHWSYSKPGFR